MALSGDEQALFDHARAAMPHWFFSNERTNEELGMAAKIMGKALVQLRHWLRTQTLIGQAVGATSTEPDWLAQHARDRNTSRQAGESDPNLRSRIRTLPNSIIRHNLLAAVQEVMTADAVAGTPAMVELPRDGIFLGKVMQDTGAEGTFTGPDVDDVMTFLGAFNYPPFKPAASVNPPFTLLSGRVRSHTITFSGSTSAANDGTFVITGLVGDAVQYVNAAGVAGADATVTWQTSRLDKDDNVLDGFGHSYASRGERINRGRGGTIIVILPYGTPDSTLKAITELLRQRKAAGIILRVERRENP